AGSSPVFRSAVLSWCEGIFFDRLAVELALYARVKSGRNKSFELACGRASPACTILAHVYWWHSFG
ncbi:MAG TPA: hypothetical protein PL009_02950, partial [Flavipsychrobacter sp.]|nr:hypothetical protein [Flavipsychrobacter sp.]